MDQPGKIILLNGTSSAGKTSLAQAIQLVMDEPWHHIALDQFRDGMPGHYRGLNSPEGSTGAAGLNIVPVRKRGELVTEVRFGPMGHRMLRGMHRAIGAFAQEGNNVIVDDLMLEPKILDDYLVALRNYRVWFIGVHCEIGELSRREIARGGRFPGTAFSHFEDVHIHRHYDFEVDTTRQSSRECAVLIKQLVAQQENSFTHPEAFNTLRRERGIQ